nr:hypothetical protein [Tanacetum cinerariifolium]
MAKRNVEPEPKPQAEPSRSDQKNDTFWYKILEVYNDVAAKRGFSIRTKNMLTGKWTLMNREITKFNSLVLETKVMSEENDENWMTRVEILYKVHMPTMVMTVAQQEEAIRGIQEHLLGVPIQEELTALRNRVDIVEAENASLRATIRTMKAIETVTLNHERFARIQIERQLASV